MAGAAGAPGDEPTVTAYMRDRPLDTDWLARERAPGMRFAVVFTEVTRRHWGR